MFCDTVQIGMPLPLVAQAASNNRDKVNANADEHFLRVTFGKWHSCQCIVAFASGKVIGRNTSCVD